MRSISLSLLFLFSYQAMAIMCQVSPTQTIRGKTYTNCAYLGETEAKTANCHVLVFKAKCDGAKITNVINWDTASAYPGECQVFNETPTSGFKSVEQNKACRKEYDDAVAGRTNFVISPRQALRGTFKSMESPAPSIFSDDAESARN